MAVNELNVTKAFSSTPHPEMVPARSYVESSEISLASIDVLRQFQANLGTLEDLNGRLRFVMSEIRGLIRK